MLTANMSEHDLKHMLACSPKLETLALIISRMPRRIRLSDQSLKCACFSGVVWQMSSTWWMPRAWAGLSCGGNCW